MVVFQRYISFRGFPVTLLPIIVFEIEVIVSLAIAIVIIVVPPAPIVMVRMKDNILLCRHVITSIVRVDAMAAAELVINHISQQLFAMLQRWPRQPLRVNGPAIA